ncbi:MAG: DNA repair protein RadA [Ignavibacteria bacterium]|nr:DNA repair protein RadA [Ignavibacteria bacterium]
MKQRTQYVCQNCGAIYAKWQGRCSSCNQWDTISQVEISKKPKSSKGASSNAVKLLSEISSDNDQRISTGIAEFDRVLGGGIIPGSLVLVGGDPGIGKSTLLLQMCSAIIEYKPLYITGEESLQQIKFRSNRLKNIPDDLLLLAETDIERIINAIQNTDCGIVIVDSIQSVFSEKIEATPGSIVQVRDCASALMQLAKQSEKPIFIVGHITKEGLLAGPKILEHLVDTVLQFEGDKTYSYRILRTLKNRFGSTNEIGIFEMVDRGLIEVSNPSAHFLANRGYEHPGIAIVASIEGTRPILIEVQALVTPTNYSVPQRTVTGFDLRRLNMILAVLEKRLGEKFSKYDVFVNIAGGLYLNDPSIDLGIAAALLSSLKDEAISSDLVLIGEIGLTGEIRPISLIEQRLNESQKLGFKRAIIPKSKELSYSKDGLKLIEAQRISLALNEIFA